MNERSTISPLRPVVLVIALVHLALGLLGFFFLPEANPAGENTLWIFSATGMLNVIRTVVGVLGVAAVLKPSAILAYSWIVFVAFAGLTAFGVLSAATTLAGDAVNVGWADNVLHALTSLTALAVALLTTRRARRDQARPSTNV
ncbi:DUF4383 domain-containing protein [Amycolatopsis regifaucium]|uniref:DUF4383 domain-containing protein n=1 Tax=Amycolatopsis regifaucium TaxID=546365 RepID=A0A154M3X7_9PSEU|nr:DUF4383 domain-containing protein [Amycolatopsis regifaucium]KZB79324.1 hypothetical protein AVL48_17195 [Amycolatopsis regifaucium]OKA07507.1 hypothetical protein ATP06_0216880 [Amycolatopsis regifaucium]SFH09771.1 protein of unknown function [Amycolatopsis regifaucium]